MPKPRTRTRKPKPGRPPAPANSRRGVKLFVRLTDAEWERLQAAVAAARLTTADYVRARLF